MSEKRRNLACLIALIGFYSFSLGCSGLPKDSSLVSTGSGGSGGSGSTGSGLAAVSTTISGTISPTTSGAGVTIALTGESQAVTTTDSSGNFQFSGLVPGTYVLTPSKSGLTFTPSSRNVTAEGSNIEANFSVSNSLQSSGPIVINGENGTVVRGLKISSTSGNCVTVTNSVNITIEDSEIGPCAGNGVKIYGGSGINVFDNYIHPETQSTGCCDRNDGIFATAAPHDLTIQGNVIAYGETNIEVLGGTSVSVLGNFLLNPRGPTPRGQQFQCWSNCSEVTVENNYVLSSTNIGLYRYAEATIDAISFGMSDSFTVQNNFVTGGHSHSGCAIIADTYANHGQILQNHLYNTGQCGIGLTDGSHTASGNYIYNLTPVTGAGNSAMYAAHYGQSSTCGPMTVANNIADAIQPSGAHSGWWYPGGCGPISIGSDFFGQKADAQLSAPSTFAPPLIPPRPKSCVALSPYSTQTSVTACNP
jgi:Right handed beta helix region